MAQQARPGVGTLRGVLHLQSPSPLGPSNAIESRLTLPAWMPIQLSGVYNDVTADGVEGGISVETVRGDIVVKRALGVIDLRSVEGIVDLSDATGTISVSSVNDAVRLMKVAGAIQAEAVNGDIQLIDLSSRDVESSTIDVGVSTVTSASAGTMGSSLQPPISPVISIPFFFLQS